MNQNWHRQWAAALDALEADVVHVETLLADDHRLRDTPITDQWTPPPGLGPLPIELRGRAGKVLARQIAATQAIAIALSANRKQAAMAARIESGGEGAPRPAYLDCSM